MLFEGVEPIEEELEHECLYFSSVLVAKVEVDHSLFDCYGEASPVDDGFHDCSKSNPGNMNNDYLCSGRCIFISKQSASITISQFSCR